MSSPEITLLIALASRAKTKVKLRGTRGICDLSFEEINALAFVADVFLSDYAGPLTRGEPDIPQPRQNEELETA